MDATQAPQAFPAEMDASGSVGVMDVRNVRSPKGWRRAFIRHLRKDGNLSRAAVLAGVTDRHVRRVRSESPRFAASCEQARAEARRTVVAKLERSALHLALHGQKVPVVSNGQVVTFKRQRFPGLLMDLLAANHRKKYGKRSEVNVNTTSVLVSVEAQKAFLSDPAYAQAICVADALLAAPRALQGPSSPSCPVDSASEAHGQTVRGVEE